MALSRISFRKRAARIPQRRSIKLADRAVVRVYLHLCFSTATIKAASLAVKYDAGTSGVS